MTVNYELGRIQKEGVFVCFRALLLPAKEAWKMPFRAAGLWAKIGNWNRSNMKHWGYNCDASRMEGMNLVTPGHTWEIWGIHRDDYEGHYFAGFGAVQTRKTLPTFPSNVLLPPSGSNIDPSEQNNITSEWPIDYHYIMHIQKLLKSEKIIKLI
jgi:hypothetical protein